MAGMLEVHVGGMFAEKSTNLQRQGKRHALAGKKVVFLKPAIDNRYGEDVVATHDGAKMDALKIYYAGHIVEKFHLFPEVQEADVVCIDEVQFLPNLAVNYIDELIYSGKKVYVAGLDMDRFGEPFGIVPYLMARAEHVYKHQAVCNFCGKDAWVTIGTEELKNDEQVNVGNDYVPACRTCADEKGGVR
jgi:thymidine kinase